MVAEDVARLVIELGAKFFVGFLVGMVVGWKITEKVYLSLATGACFGYSAWLLF